MQGCTAIFDRNDRLKIDGRENHNLLVFVFDYAWDGIGHSFCM
jgi:hypothetical protein